MSLSKSKPSVILNWLRLYQGADWDASRSRRPKPPSTVIEPRPDMVTQRIRRYEDTPERWQVTVITFPLLWSFKHFIVAFGP